MKFDPKTEEEITTSNLLPEGEYDAEVLTAEETVSKAGNPMIKINLNVFGEEHGNTRVFDYLMGSVAYKLRHFCASAGLLERYEAGDLEADEIANRTCKVKIVIKQDEEKKYPPKNEVRDYIVPADYVHSTSAKERPAPKKFVQPAPDDSDIPF